MSELHVVDGEVVNGSALAVTTGTSALALHKHATDVAGVCKEIVLRTAQTIQGRKYVRVEGWQAIANAYGFVASARDVEHVQGGIRAIGEVRRVSDGLVIATAEGFVGDDEAMWASRPEYARRAMAQTRSISRACRSALAFVVVLIDGGLSTTPAEEVPDGGFHDSAKPIPPPAGVDKLRQQLSPKPAPVQVPMEAVMDRLRKLAAPSDGAAPTPPPPTEADRQYGVDAETGEVHRPEDRLAPPYGKGNGMKLSDLDVMQLRFYEGGCKKTIADPKKAQWHDKEKALIKNIQAWIQFRESK